jgi:hypothetical protein
MNDNDRTPSEGWAELEAAEAELDRKTKEHEQRQRQRLRDPAVQRGSARATLAAMDELLGPAADAVSSAIKQLDKRLRRLGLTSNENLGTWDYMAALDTGEMVPVIHTDQLTYWEQGQTLMVLCEAQGKVKFTEVNADGSVPPLKEWEDAPPPPSRAASN